MASHLLNLPTASRLRLLRNINWTSRLRNGPLLLRNGTSVPKGGRVKRTSETRSPLLQQSLSNAQLGKGAQNGSGHPLQNKTSLSKIQLHQKAGTRQRWWSLLEHVPVPVSKRLRSGFLSGKKQNWGQQGSNDAPVSWAEYKLEEYQFKALAQGDPMTLKARRVLQSLVTRSTLADSGVTLHVVKPLTDEIPSFGILTFTVTSGYGTISGPSPPTTV